MPIAHSFDPEKNLILIEITGSNSLKDVENFVREMNEAEDMPGIEVPALVDAREAEEHRFLITEIDSIARLAATLPKLPGGRRHALVSGNRRNLGLMALFQQFNRLTDVIRIFNDIDDAMTWLEEGREVELQGA